MKNYRIFILLNAFFSVSIILSGSYLYLESSPQKVGDKADLVSSLLPPTDGLSCFNFYYHMFGPTIGTLSVYIAVGVSESLKWTLSGSQGDEWKDAHVTISSNSHFYVSI